jgi:GntR family transcriptional repressor for pyruvate dehydrogenase complex
LNVVLYLWINVKTFMPQITFKTVTRDASLTARAEQQIQDLIVNGALQPGERMPSQGELAQQLGVSRTVVREAVCLLTAKGLLEARKGSGVYVRTLDSNLMRQPFELMLRSRLINREMIMEARELLEVKLAGLAAHRAKPENIRAMEETIKKLEAGQLAPAEFASTDCAFHNAVAAAAGNPLLLAMANSINEVMIHVHFFCANLYGMARASELAVFHHSRILAQIKKNDSEGARRAMEEHMKLARTALKELEESMDQDEIDAGLRQALDVREVAMVLK